MCGCRASAYRISSREEAVNKAMGRNSRMLAKKYCMRPLSVTVAMPGGDIRYLELEFQIQGPFSKMDVRKVLLDIVHDFLADLNADTDLCSYLKNHSFTIKDIGITLFIINEKGYRFIDPNIGVASISKGNLEYETMGTKYDEVIKRELPFFKSVTSETYEEALDSIK